MRSDDLAHLLTLDLTHVQYSARDPWGAYWALVTLSPVPGFMQWVKQDQDLPLSEEDRAAKRDALAHHVTQVRPLSDRPGDEVLLGPHVVAHFDRPAEHFVLAAPGQSAVFDRVHSDAEDPWDVDTSWYERRKREVLLGCLPRPRYERVLDIGCSTGALTAELAQRAGAVTAVDASDVALRAGVPIHELRPLAADLEQLFFSLTEGTNRNLGDTGGSAAPAMTDAIEGQEGANG